eukprot:SAG25_NODE_2559_length_1534_cov_1.151220_1_plen_105_part_00
MCAWTNAAGTPCQLPAWHGLRTTPHFFARLSAFFSCYPAYPHLTTAQRVMLRTVLPLLLCVPAHLRPASAPKVPMEGNKVAAYRRRPSVRLSVGLAAAPPSGQP